MSNWVHGGKTFDRDVQQNPIGHGTIGQAHIQRSSVGGQSVGNIITPFDSRVVLGGSWSLSFNQDINNFLGYRARSGTVGSNMSITFTGTSIAIIGNNGPNYGRYDVYIDNTLANGAVNTFTPLAATYYSGGGLSASATTIDNVSTASFTSSGTIVIDAEEITYSGKTGTSFTGCTRGVNNTTAAIHQAGVNIYASSTNVEGYSAYYQDRVVTWRKDNLTPGTHTLQLVVRADKNASSGAFDSDIGGFVVGGALGAQNILTNLTYSTLTATTDGNGIISAIAFSPAGTAQQPLAIISAYPVSGATWAYPMFNAATGTYSFVTSAATTSVSLVVTFLQIGRSI